MVGAVSLLYIYREFPDGLNKPIAFISLDTLGYLNVQVG